MELTHEDQLRLNVLLANPVDAIRIDEQKLTVYALSGEGEARVKLNPNCRAEQYLRRVRELISGQVLGSPGGYPVFLKRWTRMGQTRDVNLAQLLKLGEPEAVVAVAGAGGLTDELARRAWWVEPTSDNARCMLHCAAVLEGGMGQVLAQHLVEHLPFESDPLIMVETVRLVLQPDLIDEAARLKIWQKGKHKRAYLIGFLAATPNDLPEPLPARADYASHAPALGRLREAGNRYAAMLMQALDSPGQSFVSVAENVLRKPSNQDDVVVLLNTIEGYFRAVALGTAPRQELDAIIEEAEAACQTPPDPALAALLRAVPALKAEVLALLILARGGDAVVTPILAKSTAIGSVMRKQLEPVTGRLLRQLATLRGGEPA